MTSPPPLGFHFSVEFDGFASASDVGFQSVTGLTTTVETEQRWTVTDMATSVEAACKGYGFAWLPEERIRAALDGGLLAPLNLRSGGRRYIELYLTFADAEFAGPGVRRLAEILRAGVARECFEAAELTRDPA